MSELFLSQASRLVTGVNAFEPYVYRIQKDYKEGGYTEWPSIVLITTAQATAISIVRLLPSQEYSNEVLDRRSLASLIRNLVDTHDVLRMMVVADSPDRFNLHRDILGLYIASRTRKIQEGIDAKNAQQFYLHTKKWYWDMIKKSPLYTNSMDRLKSGETMFYESRRKRVEDVCGANSDFVLGMLAELSTYVHSVPPSVWFSNVDELYSDKQSSRDHIAIWLRLTNFYMARCYSMLVATAGYESTPELSAYMEKNKNVFD